MTTGISHQEEGWPAVDTHSSEKEKNIECNAERRALTVRHLKVELEVDLDVSTKQLRRWLHTSGARQEKLRITPSLCEQIVHEVDMRSSAIHIDEAWLYLIRDLRKVRMFPWEDKVGSIKVERKSHIPKVRVAGLLYSWSNRLGWETFRILIS